MNGSRAQQNAQTTRVLFFMMLALGAGAAAADSLGPVASTNLTPFTAILGAPSLRSASMTTPGTKQFAVDAALASHSAIGLRRGEFAFLDGETLRLGFEFRHQLGPHWQWVAMLPWISHGRGFLDNIIDDWHALTGLSNGQRDIQGADRIRFEIAGARDAYRLARPASGPGDLRIELIRSLPAWRGNKLAVRGSLELPTGDAGKLTGNEAIDVAFDLLLRHAGSWRERPLAWHAQLGLLVPGCGEVLPRSRRRLIPLAGIGAVWAWRAHAHVFVQTAILTDPWLSEVKELGATVAELTVGARFAGGWHLAISEDLRIDRSPDFVARLGWRSRRD